MVSQIDLAKFVAKCEQGLRSFGLSVEQTTDFASIEPIVAAIQKPYLTEYLSPIENDFFETNSHWLILHSDGVGPVGMVGCRLDDTGDLSLFEHSVRRLQLRNPDTVHLCDLTTWQPSAARRLHRRSIYFGDLAFHPDHRIPKDREYLRLVMYISFGLAVMKWPDFEQIYSFLEEPQSWRAPLYGFTGIYPGANSWTVRPGATYAQHCLAVLPRSDFDELLRRYLGSVQQLGVVENMARSTPVAAGENWGQKASVLDANRRS